MEDAYELVRSKVYLCYTCDDRPYKIKKVTCTSVVTLVVVDEWDTSLARAAVQDVQQLRVLRAHS